MFIALIYWAITKVNNFGYVSISKQSGAAEMDQ